MFFLRPGRVMHHVFRAAPGLPTRGFVVHARSRSHAKSAQGRPLTATFFFPIMQCHLETTSGQAGGTDLGCTMLPFLTLTLF